MLDVMRVTPLADLAAGDYRLDPELSSVKIRIKGNWGLHTVKATFKLGQGALTVDDSGTLLNVSAEIDASSFYSRNSRRDKHVKSADFLDVTRYPTISFAGEDLRADGGELVLTGNVTIHGITERVDVRLGNVAMTDGLARLEATAGLDRTRFGVTHMPKRIGKDVSLTFEVSAARI